MILAKARHADTLVRFEAHAITSTAVMTVAREAQDMREWRDVQDGWENHVMHAPKYDVRSSKLLKP